MDVLETPYSSKIDFFSNQERFNELIYEINMMERSNIRTNPCFHYTLTFTTLWANSADDRLMIFFLIFTKKQDLAFHANCLLRRQFA